VSIGYGVAASGSDQPRYVASQAASVGKYGTWGISTSTQLAALADATAMGSLLLTRNATPVWILGALPVDMGSLSEADTLTLLGFELGSLMSVTGMPAAGGVPTSAALWVEGWQETLAWGVHEIELLVSGYCRTAPPPRWDDVQPTDTWDSRSGTWDDAACLGPLVNLGRWNDQAATTRWNTVPSTVTWDNYQPTN
jgi:hypothetical protein